MRCWWTVAFKAPISVFAGTVSASVAFMTSPPTAMNQPGTFTRVAAFANGYDQDIASRTWRDFQFALPFSVDSILFMGAGFIVSLLLLWSAAAALGRLARA